MFARAATLAALFLLFALATPALAQHRRLFVPAHKSAAIDGIDDSSEFYSWLSDHTLLADQYATPTDRVLVRIDLAEKSVSRLDGLTEAFRPMDAKPGADPRWLGSPDGKWVLFYGLYPQGPEAEPASNEAPATPEIVAVSIDGHRQLSFPQQGTNSVVAWLPDSRRWVEITSTEAVFHSLDDPTSATDVPLSLAGDSGVASEFTPSGATLLCVTPANHAIVTSHWEGSSENPVTFCDLDLTANPVTGRVFSIPIPPSAEIDAIAVSPDGRRIAWEWDISANPAGDRAWWRQHVPSVHYAPDPDNRIELWTSNSDGADFHMIGRADTGSQTLLWSPDGKLLYFTFGNQFWYFSVK